MGLTALDSNMKSAKHIACATAHQQQVLIGQFCATASNTEDIALSVVQPVNLQAHCGYNVTLWAEVV